MKKPEQFPFYINYMDIDLYLFWLMDNYGTDAAFVPLLDAEFGSRIHKPDKNADELLLEIRQFLCDKGFENEVLSCDKAFSENEERKERGKVNPYIPMSKRTESE